MIAKRRQAYLFYLEPYVYACSKGSNVLLFNLLDNKYIETSDKVAAAVVRRFVASEVPVAVGMSESEYSSALPFVKQIRSLYMGDVLPFAEGSGPPVVFRPQFVYGKERDNLREISDYTPDVSSLLKFVTVEFDTNVGRQKKMIGFLEELCRMKSVVKIKALGKQYLKSDLCVRMEEIAEKDGRMVFEEAIQERIETPKAFSRKDVASAATYKQLLLNRVVNTNFLGRLFVDSFGRVFGDSALPSCGNIFVHGNPADVLSGIVAALKLRPWFLTRSRLSGCKNCVWQYLCPPVSHVELVLNNHQICFNHESLRK